MSLNAAEMGGSGPEASLGVTQEPDGLDGAGWTSSTRGQDVSMM